MSDKIRILLSCGAGMSSGYLAQRTRSAAKKKGINAQIEARSESEVSYHLPNIDVLLLAPYYASQLEKFKKLAAPHGVAVAVIPQKTYAMLNGEELLNFALDVLK